MGINDRADDFRNAWKNGRPGEGIAAYHAEQRADNARAEAKVDAVRDLCARFAQYAKANDIRPNAKVGMFGGWKLGTFEGSNYSYGADQQYNWDLVVPRSGELRMRDDQVVGLNLDIIKDKIAWYVKNNGASWPWDD